MADLTGLKKRVELIDLRLKTAHGARERESAALVEVWEQIRVRFLDQNAEIATLRERISELEDTRGELQQMIHGLLSAVEGGLEQMSDETVPKIKNMAGDLLKSTVGTRGAYRFADDTVPTPAHDGYALASLPAYTDDASGPANFHRDLLDAVERSLDNADENMFSMLPEDRFEPEPEPDEQPRRIGEPASPGIRDLIARIEGAVGTDVREQSSYPEDEDDGDDELTRDLREIEALRGELHGLRERISSGSR